MADSRRELGYGATGDDVVQLQKTLNDRGYQLDTDGIFGDKTRAAVKDYQSRNNLASDGIVGSNTWGRLDVMKPTVSTTGATTATGQTQTEQSQPSAAQEQSSAPAYVESDVVKQAEAMLQQQMAAKPGEYSSQWQSQLDDVINRILNREDFSYDVNADALYQQYKDQYTRQGKLAMMDTMGQAAALTGGYGNSYAQTVGQQTYQGYLQQLNDVVPELYQLALDQYNQEGDDLYNQYSLLANQDEMDYDRYRDMVSDYYNDLDYLTEDARYKGEDDYNKYLTDRNLAYQLARDAVEDEQWQKEYDEAVRQYDQEYAAAYQSFSPAPSLLSLSDLLPLPEEPPLPEELPLPEDWMAEIAAVYPGKVITDSADWQYAIDLAGSEAALTAAGYRFLAKNSKKGGSLNNRDNRLI